LLRRCKCSWRSGSARFIRTACDKEPPAIICRNLSDSRKDNSGASNQGLGVVRSGATDALLGAVLVERKPLTLRLGPLYLSYTRTRRETKMAIVKNDQPFAGISDLMTQNFEQTRKAMEKYADLLEKGMKASPWLDADLNKKIKDYTEKNIAAVNEFMRKLSETKDVQSFWLVQTNFMQTQWKILSEQVKDLGETVTKNVTGAFKDIAA
jgi:hypothetical protein